MATENSINQEDSTTATGGGESKTGLVAGLSNIVFSGGACGLILGVSTLLSPGCLLYLAYTSLGVGIVGSVSTGLYDSIPGSSMATKMGLLAVILFGLFASGVLLPFTPSLTKPVSLAFNMIYFAAAALVATTAIAVMYLRVNGTSVKEVACRYC